MNIRRNLSVYRGYWTSNCSVVTFSEV